MVWRGLFSGKKDTDVRFSNCAIPEFCIIGGLADTGDNVTSTLGDIHVAEQVRVQDDLAVLKRMVLERTGGNPFSIRRCWRLHAFSLGAPRYG